MRVTHIVVALVLVACGKKPEAVQSPGTAGADTKGGMQMTMQGVQMMPGMRAHLDSLGSMQPAQIAATMAAHQDIASRMMDAMGADMRGMSMKPDSAWAALSDSLRQDLAEVPRLSGGALQGRMQAHAGRMRRMLAMHEEMMRM